MESIKENSRFRIVYSRGKKIIGKHMVLYYYPNRLGKNRYGITVSKKIGKAVVRNKVKRRIKESLRLLENQTKVGFDIIMVARNSATAADYNKLYNTCIELLKKAELLSE